MKRIFNPAVNTIFLDMDGVLADFDRRVLEIFGRLFDHAHSTDAEETQMWDVLSKIDRLYFHLEPLPTAHTLWTLAHSLGKVEVLTAIPRRTTIPTAEQDKREWIPKHFAGSNTPIRIGPYSRDKWKHATPGDILVDDRRDNITDWINKGQGIGIHYTDFGTAAVELIRLT